MFKYELQSQKNFCYGNLKFARYYLTKSKKNDHYDRQSLKEETMKRLSLITLIAILLSPIAAMAQTEIQFWHAFTGRLGELVDAQVSDFNSSQSD